LVNDFFIGLVAMKYVWVIFPLVCEGFSRLSPKAANVAFALIIVGFAACVTASYLELKLWDPNPALIQAFKSRAIALLKTYYFVGGMPEAVSAFLDSR
ncbi:hypothetical protein NE591_15220, partial [Adlercreutzia sp. DFI.6.23]|nr:hypothetical protein [Adlercreutzia sp. DFI.6.23]